MTLAIFETTVSDGNVVLPVHPQDPDYEAWDGYIMLEDPADGTADVLWDLPPKVYTALKAGGSADHTWVSDGADSRGDFGSPPQDVLYIAPVGYSPPANTDILKSKLANLAPANDYAVWQVRSTKANLVTIHDDLVAINAALGALAVVTDWVGQTFRERAVFNATNLTKAQWISKRDTIANYIDGLGHDATAIGAATDEDALAVGLAAGYGLSRADLFGLMTEA